MENVNAFKAGVSAVLAVCTALWGWFGWLLIAWVGCMTIDYLTGYSQACKNGEWSSTIAREGLWHKLGCLVTVIAAGILDAVVGHLLTNVELPFDYTVLFCPMVVVWYILMEIGSILENVGKLGAPLPPFLVKALAVLQDKVDEAGEAIVPNDKGEE